MKRLWLLALSLAIFGLIAAQSQGQQQETASLEVSIEPQSPTVFVLGPDGYIEQMTKNMLTDLQPGSYIVGATMRGYNPARGQVEVQGGETANVSLSLMQVGQTQQETFLQQVDRFLVEHGRILFGIFVVLVGVVLAIWALRTLTRRVVQLTGLENFSNLSWTIVLTGLMVLLGSLFLAVVLFLNPPITSTAMLIALSAVLLLVISLLFLVTVGFKGLGLTDPAEALALPSGSIRALIALLLLFMFVGAGIYVFERVGFPTPGETIIRNIPRAELGLFGEAGRNYEIVNAAPDGATLDIRPLRPPLDIARDLGVQILTTLATLVTAVAGFYFGARAVAAAHEATGQDHPPSQDQPRFDNRNPAQLSAAAGQILTVTGASLEKVARLFLRHGEDRKEGTIGQQNGTTLTASFDLTDAAQGSWAVIAVVGSLERDTGLTVTITPSSGAQTPSPPEVQPAPQDQPRFGDRTPAQLSAAAGQELTITGDSLEGVTRLFLQHGDDRILGTTSQQNRTTITASFDLGGATPGSWDIRAIRNGGEIVTNLKVTVT